MASQVQQLTDALNQIDAATTKAGDAVVAIGARITRLLENIDEVQALAVQATAEAAKLQPVADSLASMGTDPADPVPDPVPEPEPVA